jgi:ParB/RepB/Spo0J family partition protein
MTKNPPTKATPVAQAVVAAIAGTTETAMLRPDEIAPSPTNPRKTFPEASLAELADSMARDGQVQAILVRPITTEAVLKFNREHPDATDEQRIARRYEIVSGERRWRAAQLKGLQLRAEIRALTDLQVVRIQIVENLHREEVHPLEEAEGYEYLLKHSGENITTEQIADEVGKSKSYVLKRLKLASLCAEARKDFIGGKFDASTALLIARMATPGLQMKAIEEIASLGGWRGDDYEPSYREIRDHLSRRFHLQLAHATFDTKSEDLVAGCGSCVACPKRTGNQSALFDDVNDADICTDPDCFAAKKAAGYAAQIADARRKGIRVIEGEEAEKLMPQKWMRTPDDYVDLQGCAYEVEKDDTYEEVTYAQLVEQAGKKAPKQVLFVDPHRPDAAPMLLITRKDADALEKRFPAPAEESSAGHNHDETDTEPDPQYREDQIARIYRDKLVEALIKKADAARTAADLMIFIFVMAGDEITDDLITAAGGTEPEEDADSEQREQHLFDALLQLDGGKLAALAFRLALGNIEAGYGMELPPARVVERAAQSHGVDLAKTRKQAEKAFADDEDN